MVKVRMAQSSFSLGEFSRLLAARSDLAQYRNGAERLLNRRLLSQGGTDTRPGLRRFGAVPEGHGRLVAYQFDATQKYLLHFGDAFCQPYTMNGTALPRITGAPWSASHLKDLRLIQSGDTMLVFHPDWPPRRIQRFSATDFRLDEMPLEYIPYYRFVHPSVTLEPSALTGPVIFTASATIFTQAMVGSTILFRGSRALIVSIATPTAANAEWVDATDGLTLEPSTEWEEAAWSATRGWPITGVFFSGRLAIGGSRDLPNTIWLSRSGAYYNWKTGVDDADALSEVAAGQQSGRIVHLVAAARLLVLTDTAAWALVGSTNGPITPSNVSLRPAAPIGANRLQPAEVDGATLFLDATGATLREIQIDEYLNGFTANPVSLLAEHLIRQPVAMTVLRGNAVRPEVYAVLVNEDGGVSVFHSLRQEKIAAFTPWDTAGRFRDICAVGQELFALVERTGGWSIERFDEDAAPLDDSRRATSGEHTRSFAGFGHLAGRTVGVVSRGHDLGDVTVSSTGAITLPDTTLPVTEIDAGHRYRQVIRPMPADMDMQDGPARGLKKRLLRVILQVDRSGQLNIAGRNVLLQFQGDDVDTLAATHTGVIRKRMLGVSLDAQFDIEVEGAQKVTILGLTRELSING